MRHSLCAALVLALVVTPAGAQLVTQVTDQKLDRHGEPVLDDAGATVYAVLKAGLFSPNPARIFQVAEWDAASGAGSEITAFADGVTWRARSISVSDDGQWLAFASSGNLTGQNHDESLELFTMRTDGSMLEQITDDPAVNAGNVLHVALAGSANRIAFVSSGDYGTNPSREPYLFTVDFDGTGLIQIPLLAGPPSISDDGTRVAVRVGTEIFAVNHDGTGQRQLTSGTGSTSDPRISGNGERVAFTSNRDLTGLNPSSLWQVFVVNWDGSGTLQLTPGDNDSDGEPSIQDDGLVVWYSSAHADPVQNADGNDEIWKVNSDGSGRTAVTQTTAPRSNVDPVVSGSGNRVAFTYSGGELSAGSNPDGEAELAVMDSAGGNAVQLTDHEAAPPDFLSPGALDVTPGDSRIVFFNLVPDWAIWRIDADGGNLLQLADMYTEGLSTDGTTVVFDSFDDPFGTNAGIEIFAVEMDGAGLRQVTTSAFGVSRHPAIAGNGSWIAYESVDFPPGELYVVRPDGSGKAPIVSDGDSVFKLPRIDDSGTWVAYQSAASGPLNPSGILQIFRVRTDGTGRQQVTLDAAHGGSEPDISGSGDRILYRSGSDPLGTNPANLLVCFVYEVSTATTFQVTDHDCRAGRISGDGQYVVYASTDVFESEAPAAGIDLYRAAVDTGQVDRIGAMHRRDAEHTGYVTPRDRYFYLAPGDDGRFAVFAGTGDWTGTNPDVEAELYRVDQDAPNPIRVSAASPTVVSWGPDPRFRRYDVVRGDVANLAVSGATVDLGATVCVEDDSPDLDTIGDEDLTDPGPGQAFFYLFRGTQGLAAGPGSYGDDSAGRERIAGAGDCAG